MKLNEINCEKCGKPRYNFIHATAMQKNDSFTVECMDCSHRPLFNHKMGAVRVFLSTGDALDALLKQQLKEDEDLKKYNETLKKIWDCGTPPEALCINGVWYKLDHDKTIKEVTHDKYPLTPEMCGLHDFARTATGQICVRCGYDHKRTDLAPKKPKKRK